MLFITLVGVLFYLLNLDCRLTKELLQIKTFEAETYRLNMEEYKQLGKECNG